MPSKRCFAAVFLILASACPALAGPTSDSHDAMFVWSKVEGTKSLYDEVTAGYQVELKAVEAHVAAKTQRLQNLGRTQANLHVLGRSAVRLSHLGEPAAFDLTYRILELMRVTWELIDAAQLTTPGQRTLEQVNRGLPKFRAELLKAKQAAENALANNELDAAERAIFALKEKANPALMMLGRNYHEHYRPVKELESQIRSEREKLMRAEGNRMFTEARDAMNPDLAAIRAELGSAVRAVGAAGKATVDEMELTGPQLINHIERRWVSTARAMLAARAYEWARCAATQETQSPAIGTIEKEYASLAADLKAAVLATIEADTQRLQEGDVAATYREYVMACGQLTSRMNDESFESRLEQQLANLASKSPTLQREVTAYVASTDEWLRWQSRMTEQRASSQSQFPSLKHVFVAALEGRDSFGGIYGGRKTTTLAQLSMASNRIVQRGAEKMIGSTARLGTCVGAPTRTASAANYDERVWGVIRNPDEVAPAADAFKQQIVLSDGRVLSLRAAQAVALTDRRDWQAAGGTINKVSLESAVGRFATLSPNLGYLVRLGEFPQEEIQTGPSKQLTLRAGIAPTWLANRFFFVELPPPQE